MVVGKVKVRKTRARSVDITDPQVADQIWERARRDALAASRANSAAMRRARAAGRKVSANA